MGRRGPPPKPTKLKLLTGNPGKRAINHREPKPAPAAKGARKVPVWMPPDGKREWKRVVPELERLGLLTKVDDAALEGYCNAYARALQAGRHVKKNGITIVTDKGFIIAHPAVSMEKNAWAQVRQFGSEFGLTPSARTRIQVDKDPPQDTDADFLFKTKTGSRTA